MQYQAPDSFDAAVALLNAEAGISRVLAGGTDVLVQLRSGMVTPLVSALIASLGVELPPHRIWNRIALGSLVLAAYIVTPRGTDLRADERPFRPLSGWRQETFRPSMRLRSGRPRWILPICTVTPATSRFRSCPR